MKHLPRYNDIGKHNGRFLTEELGKIKGLIHPLMLSDWTSMLETGGNGKRNGKGTLTIPDGLKYEGEWKDDKFWTEILYDKNGNIHHKFGNGKPLKQYTTLKPTPHHPL